MSELKPCPFCGGSNVKDEPALQVVICMDCGAEIDTDLGEWNKRPIEDALNARIAELELLVSKQFGRIVELEKEALSHGVRDLSQTITWTASNTPPEVS